METLERIIWLNTRSRGTWKSEYIELLVGCASNVKFDAGEFLFREGEEANQFYLIRHGVVAVELFAGRRPDDHHDHDWRRRGARVVLAVPALPLEIRRPRRGTDQGDCAGREMFENQMRGGPRPGIRTSEAFRLHGGAEIGRDPFAVVEYL